MTLQFIKDRIAYKKEQFIEDLMERGHSQPYAEVQWFVGGGEENTIHALFEQYQSTLTYGEP